MPSKKKQRKNRKKFQQKLPQSSSSSSNAAYQGIVRAAAAELPLDIEIQDGCHKVILSENGETESTNKIVSIPVEEMDCLFSALKQVEGVEKLDAKRLKRMMPKTSESILTGKVSPEDFSAAASLLYCTKARPRLTGPNEYLNTFEGIMSISLSRSLTMHMLGMHRVPSDTKIVELFDRIKADFLDILKRHSLKDFGAAQIVHRNVRYICRKYADDVDELLYNGQRGSFLKECAIYKKSKEEVGTLVIDLLMNCNIDHHLQNILFNAAQGVQKRLGQLKETCWECDLPCETSNWCAGCDVARYCGKWKDQSVSSV